MSMTFYETDNRRQQVEILRRFSTEIFKDTDCDLYSPYTRTEEIEEHLLHLFFSHYGVTSIALYYGCPEIIIMKKILSMNLYARYDELVAQLRKKERILGVEDSDRLYTPRNQHDKDLDQLRRATPFYPCSQFEWTEDERNLVFFLFKMGEDISDIALLLGCTEWMVMQKFLDDGLYGAWDTPWFAYSDQECRDRFVRDNGYNC